MAPLIRFIKSLLMPMEDDSSIAEEDPSLLDEIIDSHRIEELREDFKEKNESFKKEFSDFIDLGKIEDPRSGGNVN